jgi:hypothetical protein
VLADGVGVPVVDIRVVRLEDVPGLLDEADEALAAALGRLNVAFDVIPRACFSFRRRLSVLSASNLCHEGPRLGRDLGATLGRGEPGLPRRLGLPPLALLDHPAGGGPDGVPAKLLGLEGVVELGHGREPLEPPRQAVNRVHHPLADRHRVLGEHRGDVGGEGLAVGHLGFPPAFD